MNLCEMIQKRRSVRKYKADILDDICRRQILETATKCKPLVEGIAVKFEFADREEVKSMMPFVPPQVLCIYSEEKEGYLENAGFLMQQMDLYLQQQGFGTCWLGLGKPGAVTDRLDDLKFVMMLCVGKTDVPLRDGAKDFNRKPLLEICDSEDLRLEAARLAPSSINSQPWYFVHDGELIHVYCGGGVLKPFLQKMNRMDIGVALAHLYVSYPDSFLFERKAAPKLPGKRYIGSVKLQ